MTRKISNRVIAFCLALLAIVTAIPTVAFASSTQITGKSTTAQTVYTGPSSTYYEAAGSISQDETVYILGKEKGLNWYHIQYHVGSQQKSGYVPVSTITSISGGTPAEEEYYGGYAVSNAKQTVWSCDDPSIAINIGSVGDNEGVTRLYAYGNVMFVEYSTSGKAKRGYIFNPDFSYPADVTCVARVTQDSDISYGCKSGYSWGRVGSVDAGEYVAVLAGSNSKNMIYVEYNTSNGRKRGYMSASNVSMHGGVTVASLPDMYGILQGVELRPTALGSSGETMHVYAGPGTSYYKVDELAADYATYYDGEEDIDGHNWLYIIYNVNGVWKSGFIINS